MWPSVCVAVPLGFVSERVGGTIPAAHEFLARTRCQDPAGARFSVGRLKAYYVRIFQVNAVGFLGVS